MFDRVSHIARLIAQKLWAVSTLTLLFAVLIFWLWGGFFSFCFLVFGLAAIFYNAQDLLLYYPNDPPDSRIFVLQPSNFKLPHESIKIPTKDGLLIHLFFIKQANNGSNAPTMLFFHGNAGNMGQRLSNVQGFYHKLNLNILMMEYRGYGLSEGSPSEGGLYTDAQSALDYLLQRSDIDQNKIILFGRSLGGAIAIDLASRLEYRNKIWALIVENTFTSIPDMAQIILKWQCLRYLPRFIHKNKYASLEKMGHVLSSTLVVCGSNDGLVPPAMSDALHQRCAALHKSLLLLPGGGHDDTWTCRDYYTSLAHFLASCPAIAHTVPYLDEYPISRQPSKHFVIHTV